MKAITFRRKALLALIVAMFGMGSLAHAAGGTAGDRDKDEDRQDYPAPTTQQHDVDSDTGDQEGDYPTPPPAQ